MGRTIPSFRVAEEQEASEWKTYRLALSRKDRESFDEMLRSTKLYTSASSTAIRASRFEGMAMAMIFHHYKALAQLFVAASELVRTEGDG